jgi:hypothetical protein
LLWLLGQHQYIPPVLFIAYFLQQNLKVLLCLFHVNHISQCARRELIFIVE